MEVYVVTWESNVSENGELYFIAGVFASEDLADKERDRLVAHAHAEGKVVYGGASGEVEWDVDVRVTPHTVMTAA